MVEINYTPSTFTTAEVEIKFRTTEFDSQPVLCRIVGNALPTRQNINGAKDVKPEEEADFQARKVHTRTLLTNKREMLQASSRAGAGVRLEKIPEDALSKTQAYSVEPMDRNTLNLGATDTRDANLSKTPVNNMKGKVTVMEQNFIKEYRHLEDLEREKGIKFFQCIGDAPITKSTIDSIKD
jgi:hypothetical protein